MLLIVFSDVDTAISTKKWVDRCVPEGQDNVRYLVAVSDLKNSSVLEKVDGVFGSGPDFCDSVLQMLYVLFVKLFLQF